MMTRAQKELSAALGNLSDANGGVVAQVESANNRLTQSLEKRENALDALLHQLNTWLLCFWIPLISTATLVIGLVAGMGIRGCMDSVPAAAATPDANGGASCSNSRAARERRAGWQSKAATPSSKQIAPLSMSDRGVLYRSWLAGDQQATALPLHPLRNSRLCRYP